MKAIFYHHYGPPDVLKLSEMEKPVPKDHEVLVKVCAASINSWDWDMVRGKPWIVRLWGLFKPRYKIPGADLAGIVEAVGNSVTRFQPGDEVLGDLCEDKWGAFAEYTCAHERALSLKPPRMSFEVAASLPQAGLMALQSITKAKLEKGQHMLFNGAAGGVGTFAIQFAKLLGAEVTAVDSAGKLDLLRSLGADHVIDYTREDFTRHGKHYDLIIDVVSNRSLSDYKRCLTSHGQFIMIGGTMSAIIRAMLRSRSMSKGNQKLGMLAYQPNKDLDDLTRLVDSGKIISVIDKNFPLSQTAEAFRYYATGVIKGKIVITI
jgi:NADPH:quinone reductase-like Zn-dependent oxidoreductase